MLMPLVLCKQIFIIDRLPLPIFVFVHCKKRAELGAKWSRNRKLLMNQNFNVKSLDIRIHCAEPETVRWCHTLCAFVFKRNSIMRQYQRAHAHLTLLTDIILSIWAYVIHRIAIWPRKSKQFFTESIWNVCGISTLQIDLVIHHQLNIMYCKCDFGFFVYVYVCSTK